MDVRSLMTKDPVTVQAGETARVAADLMRAHKIRHLPVVDRTDKLVGIVTDRDIRQILFAPALRTRMETSGTLPDQITVGEIMSAPVVTATPYMDVAEAAKVMHERKIGALPVVERAKVVGILSEIDVLKAFYELMGRPPKASPEDW
jgi:acetoin utilization protein AcuB